MRWNRKHDDHERGVSGVEYAILVAMIGTVLIGSLNLVGSNLSGTFSQLKTFGSPAAGTDPMGGGASELEPPSETPTLFVFDTSVQASQSGQVTLPVDATPTAESVIDWGDGTVEPFTRTAQTHTYAAPAEYIVSYVGPISRVYSYGSSWNPADACLTAVLQWGSLAAPTAVSFVNESKLTAVAEPPHTVTDMSAMFYRATAFNQPIGDWDTSNVTNMREMFAFATAFNQPVGGWDVSKVTNMSGMFNSASSFNQPIGAWDTSAATRMDSMFSFASAFNQPIGAWDVSKVTTMNGMFFLATTFNQPLSTWQVGKVENSSGFRAGSALTSANSPTGW